MGVETKAFDLSEVLNSEERIAAYLEEAFESGEPAVIAAALGAVARARNISVIAKEAGWPELGGRCPPNPLGYLRKKTGNLVFVLSCFLQNSGSCTL
jgi:hypothetical protein